MVEKDAVLFNGVNVTAEPLSFACADLVEVSELTMGVSVKRP